MVSDVISSLVKVKLLLFSLTNDSSISISYTSIGYSVALSSIIFLSICISVITYRDSPIYSSGFLKFHFFTIF